MKVKIIKCSNPDHWYNWHINQTYEVSNYNNKEYITDEIINYGNINAQGIILKKDCKIIVDK